MGPYYVPDQGDYYYWNNFAAPAGQTAREEPIDVGGYDFDVDLFWTDPLGASTNDYDLYMLDDLGYVVYSSENTQDGTQDPYEHIDDTAQYSSGYYLVITLFQGVSRFMYMGFGRGALYWATSGCTKGHNACDAHNSFAVASHSSRRSNRTQAIHLAPILMCSIQAISWKPSAPTARAGCFIIRTERPLHQANFWQNRRSRLS